MGSRTHYEVLGVSPSADRPTIEKAYRRKVRFVHPDVSDSPESLDRFYTIQRAYESLRDPDNRREYDAQLAERAASGASPVVAKRAAARRRAAEAREQSGVTSPGGFVHTAGPFWDPASNPVLRRKIQKSRRRKWLARLETVMLATNVALAGVAVVSGVMLFLDSDEPAGGDQGPGLQPWIRSDLSEPTEVERFLAPLMPDNALDGPIEPGPIDPEVPDPAQTDIEVETANDL